LFTALAVFDAVFRAKSQLWPDLLKEGFNCSDLPDMVFARYSSVVNGWKMRWQVPRASGPPVLASPAGAVWRLGEIH
jgi:hypothetical protein